MGRTFEDIALSEGVVSKQQYIDALEYADTNKKKIWDALVALGYITESGKLKLLSKQLQIGIFDEDEIDHDPELLEKFEKRFITKHRFIPYRKTDISLQILVADTSNLPLEDELNRKFMLVIDYLLVSEKKIDEWIYQNISQEDLTSELEKIQGETISQDTFDINTEDSNTPVVINAVNQIIKEASVQKASDIHIMPTEAYLQVRYRIDGILHERRPLPLASHSAIVSRIKTMTNSMDIAEKRKPQDGKIQVTIDGIDMDLRVSTLPSIHGEKVTIRILDKSSMRMEIDNLNLLPDTEEKFRKIIQNPVGIMLITGPTGSGKSTTLYTAITHLNDITRNIITVEDPVEYQMEGITQVQVNHKAELDFASALKSILRQDPDIILVGEIRDEETASMAVQAANTGHLVLSTLHTNDAASALTRLIDMGIEPYMIADSLIAVINQRLVRKLCEHCREPYKLHADSRYRKLFGIGDDDITVYREVGCKKCRDVGFAGRLPLHELLFIDDDIKLMLSSNVSPFELKTKAVENGMRLLKMDGLEKVKLGLTTFEEIQRLVTLE